MAAAVHARVRRTEYSFVELLNWLWPLGFNKEDALH